MMLKITGALLMICCGAVFGARQLWETKGWLATMEALDRALGTMEAEIKLSLRPLPDIFALLSSGKLGAIFDQMEKNCERAGAEKAWKMGVEAMDLPEGARLSLQNLGSVLGRYEPGRQAREIEAAREALRSQRESLRMEKETKKRHYPLLGGCLAGIAAMIII